jgi:uncharacterized protein (TIGR02284 family)
MTDKSAVNVVNDLVEICLDAEKGFRDAAQDVRDQNLREIFLGKSRQMGQFGRALQEEVTKLGGKPSKSGSMVGTLHRVWMDSRATLNMHNAKLVLMECERGESAVLQHYEKALEAVLPEQVKDVIEKQFVEITLTRNKLHELEHPEERPGEPDKKYNLLKTE